MHLVLCTSDSGQSSACAALAECLGIEFGSEAALPASCTHILRADAAGLSLLSAGQGVGMPAATRVDFTDPALLYRLRTSGKAQGLGKALGLAKHPGLRVVDATAGLGRDALLMAYLGAEVLMLERSALIHALLADGLERGHKSAEPMIRDALSRMRLQHAEARNWLSGLAAGEQEELDVIYLDPMFPPRSKSAKVKKDIALLQEVLGVEEDFLSLLELARQTARMRVVVKRPGNKSDPAAPTPSFIVPGKTAHFEVYVSNSFSSMR